MSFFESVTSCFKSYNRRLIMISTNLSYSYMKLFIFVEKYNSNIYLPYPFYRTCH